jgi:hypothetical protein
MLLLWDLHGKHAVHETQIIYKDSVHTSQETNYVPAINVNRLMLFRETVVAYCKNRKKNEYIVWAEMSVELNFEAYVVTTEF